MADIVADGWLWLSSGSDYLKLACKVVKWDYAFNPKLTHMVGEINFGYDLKKRWVVVKAFAVLFSDSDSIEDTISYLKQWNEDGPFTLELIKNNSDDKLKLDGDNTSIEVFATGLKAGEKVSPGNQTIYKIEMLTFEQGG